MAKVVEGEFGLGQTAIPEVDGEGGVNRAVSADDVIFVSPDRLLGGRTRAGRFPW